MSTYTNYYIKKYLLPREILIFTVRQHPAALLPSVATAVGGLLAASVVTNTYGAGKPSKIIVWTLVGWLIIRFVWNFASWFGRWMVLTSERFLLIKGSFASEMKSIPLPRLMEMTFTRSATGKLFGFGTFTIEADGKPQIVIDYVPFSEQIQQVLGGRLYTSAADQASDSYYGEPEFVYNDADLEAESGDNPEARKWSPVSWSERIISEYSDVLGSSAPDPSSNEPRQS